MSPQHIETRVGKFVFKVHRACRYSAAGVWVRSDGVALRVGLTDYVQQANGDMAFVTVAPVGTRLAVGDELCTIETIKVAISVPSPVTGTITEVNGDLETSPELVNEDPYGVGWLAVIDPTDWPGDQARLLDAEAYTTVMRGQAEEEMGQR